ncbi:hypothetical protein BDR06DRAFT_435063 [Suillus hirtellus]|nr:hypothetical protein BDR06DRAFT_435063 [Suillus hirtellus]
MLSSGIIFIHFIVLYYYCYRTMTLKLRIWLLVFPMPTYPSRDLLVFFPPPTLVCRPHSSEPCQQLLTCTGRLRMAFVVELRPIVCKFGRTRFECEPDLPNVFGDVRSRVQPNG